MKIALIMGGAKCLFDDMEAAQKLFTPDVWIAVKDIGITHPQVDHWVTFHIDRVPREIKIRREVHGLPDPQAIWTHNQARFRPNVGIPLRFVKSDGGSSGLLGVWAALEVADKAVLCGVPLDPNMPHYHNRKGGKDWKEAKAYHDTWRKSLGRMNGRVRSMSGWTSELLGVPDAKWLAEEFNAGAAKV